ncbi:hypothetical protein GCM10009741_78260 [Kribbella lupini]|uniref:Uncharacterized protein n=1 Tax=Kribbella lupini TaxID=291602 RepID=A0ABN2CPU6_9ACTN
MDRAGDWCDTSDIWFSGDSFWCLGPDFGMLSEPGDEGGNELRKPVKCLWGMG